MGLKAGLRGGLTPLAAGCVALGAWPYLMYRPSRLALAAAGRARLPVPGARLAYYYFVVTKATIAGLVRYVRSGTPQMWDKAKGTR